MRNQKLEVIGVILAFIAVLIAAIDLLPTLSEWLDQRHATSSPEPLTTISVTHMEIAQSEPAWTPTATSQFLPTPTATLMPTSPPEITNTPIELTAVLQPSPVPTKTPVPANHTMTTEAPAESATTLPVKKNKTVVIETEIHHIGDNTESKWDVPRPEGKSYVGKFQLDNSWSGNALLQLDTWHVDYPDPIWINDHLVGAVPRDKNFRWYSEQWVLQGKVYVPHSALRTGENTIKIEARKTSSGYEDFMFRNLRLVMGEVVAPDSSEFTSLLVDNEVHYIGDKKTAEGTSYTKSFSLDSALRSDAILFLSSSETDYANGVWVNACYIGVLPGTEAEAWTPVIQMHIPMQCLLIGNNVLQINSVTKDGNYDDFMVKNIQIKAVLK